MQERKQKTIFSTTRKTVPNVIPNNGKKCSDGGSKPKTRGGVGERGEGLVKEEENEIKKIRINRSSHKRDAG